MGDGLPDLPVLPPDPRAIQAAGFQPNVIANTESVCVSSALVRAGADIAILPGLALAGVTDLAIRPIVPPITRRLYAVFRKDAHLRPSIATALNCSVTPRHAWANQSPLSPASTGRPSRLADSTLSACASAQNAWRVNGDYPARRGTSTAAPL